MKKIILTSCGIIDDKLKQEFIKLLDNKNIEAIKLLYITTAVDGESDPDKSWVDEEYKTILDLGIKEENITEFKLDYDIDFNKYDAIYMMGGNTFYLMKKIRENNWIDKIISAINNGIIYIGSSAGSEILSKSIETALGYDENNVNITDFTGLNIVDGLVIPHSNRKQKFIEECKGKYSDKIYTIEDKHGFIIIDGNENYY